VHRELQRREVLTVLEYAAYLTTARALGPTHHAIAVLGDMMGLRASEMAGLRVDCLTSVRGYTTLTFIGKGDKPARGHPHRPCRRHRTSHRPARAPPHRRHGRA
jgi:integrase/recombinase XerC/integrase/recombinase XerD